MNGFVINTLTTQRTIDEIKGSIYDLSKDGLDLIRYQFTGAPDWFQRFDYQVWLDDHIKNLNEILPYCESLKMKVILDLHTPYGGTEAPQNPEKDKRRVHKLFIDNKEQRKKYRKPFIADWQKLANIYKNDDRIWAFELLNEPQCIKVKRWRTLYRAAAKSIWQVDKNRKLIVGGTYDSPAGIRNIKPIKNPSAKVFYTVHLYQPKSKYTKIQQIEIRIQHLIEWLQKYSIPTKDILIGEVGRNCLKYPAHEIENFLIDAIELFKELGFHICVHAKDEANEWNYEKYFPEVYKNIIKSLKK